MLVYHDLMGGSGWIDRESFKVYLFKNGWCIGSLNLHLSGGILLYSPRLDDLNIKTVVVSSYLNWFTFIIYVHFPTAFYI